jgi:hypothetical protein
MQGHCTCMVKKPFTTRLDEEVLEAAQAIAEIERRSVTSVIEVAVMDYAARVISAVRGSVPPDSPAEGSWRLKIHCPDGSRRPDQTFMTADDLLVAAATLTTEHPELKLVVTVPRDASDDDRKKVHSAGYTEALWPG